MENETVKSARRLGSRAGARRRLLLNLLDLLKRCVRLLLRVW